METVILNNGVEMPLLVLAPASSARKLASVR